MLLCRVPVLNGCVPMIVLDSADLDAVVDCVVDAAWTNQGQACNLYCLKSKLNCVCEIFEIFLSFVESLGTSPYNCSRVCVHSPKI